MRQNFQGGDVIKIGHAFAGFYEHFAAIVGNGAGIAKDFSFLRA